MNNKRFCPLKDKFINKKKCKGCKYFIVLEKQCDYPNLTMKDRMDKNA